MKIHHLNCGIMHPRGARYVMPYYATVPCNCLLIETGEDLLLVDAGIGTRDIEDRSRLGRTNALLNAQLDPEQTAIRHIQRLGFRPEDVGHIICTHLDRDHAGGLSDFPNARVHVLRAEYEAVLNPRVYSERERYRECHFAHDPRWVIHENISTEPWFGMDCIRELPEIPPSVLLVPLPGHTRGHSGVAIETGDGWLLHCGDTYYVKDELLEGKRVPLGIRCFRFMAHVDRSMAQHQVERLKELSRKDDVEIELLAAHDPGE